ESLHTHRLDIVAVGVEQERGVIGRAVIMPVASGAVVAAAGLQSLGMGFLDRGMVLCAEGDMGAGVLETLVQMQPQRRLTLRPEARTIVVFRAEYIAERRQRRGVEAHGGIEVTDFQSDMVVHDALRSARVKPRDLEISYSMQGDAFLENLALAPGVLPELERGHARRAMEGAHKIGEIVEPD